MKYLTIITLLLIFSSASGVNPRIWTNEIGQQIEGSFIEADQAQQNITVKKTTDNSLVTIPISTLSTEDQLFLDQHEYFLLRNKPETLTEEGIVIILAIEGDDIVIRDELTNETITKSSIIMGTSIGHDHKITTGFDSSISLLFSNGTSVNVEPQSELSIQDFYQKDFESSEQSLDTLEKEPTYSYLKLYFNSGKLIINTTPLNDDSTFHIETSTGVAGIRGTEFEISEQDGTFGLNVAKGQVDFFDHSNNSFKIRSNKGINFQSKHPFKNRIYSSKELPPHVKDRIASKNKFSKNLTGKISMNKMLKHKSKWMEKSKGRNELRKKFKNRGHGNSGNKSPSMKPGSNTPNKENTSNHRPMKSRGKSPKGKKRR